MSVPWVTMIDIPRVTPTTDGTIATYRIPTVNPCSQMSLRKPHTDNSNESNDILPKKKVSIWFPRVKMRP